MSNQDERQTSIKRKMSIANLIHDDVAEGNKRTRWNDDNATVTTTKDNNITRPKTSAREQVFITHELAEEILINATPETIRNASKVAKAFHAASRHSRQVRLAAVLKPTRGPVTKTGELIVVKDTPAMLFYQHERPIAIHRVLDASLGDDVTHTEVAVEMNTETWLRVGKCLYDYATLPPVTAVGLDVITSSSIPSPANQYQRSFCAVYRSRGVRMIDIHDCLVEMMGGKVDTWLIHAAAHFSNGAGFTWGGRQ